MGVKSETRNFEIRRKSEAEMRKPGRVFADLSFEFPSSFGFAACGGYQFLQA